jgi:cell division protein FtsB
MSNQTLIDVNATNRALAHADRHGGRVYLDEIERDPAPEILTLSDVLQGEIALTLKTRNGSELQLSTRIITILGGLLLACASCAFYLIYTTATVATSQKYEAEIRAKDYAELKRDNAELKGLMRDYQAQVVSGFTTTQAYISANSNKVQFMTGLLSREQQRAVNEYDRTHPTIKPPDPDTFKFRDRQPDNTNEHESEGQTN